MSGGAAAHGRDEVIGRLRAWFVEKNLAITPDAIAEDTDLVTGRVLESLQVIEFILFLERECGRTILVEGLDPSSLRTLAEIYARFFVDEQAAS